MAIEWHGGFDYTTFHDPIGGFDFCTVDTVYTPQRARSSYLASSSLLALYFALYCIISIFFFQSFSFSNFLSCMCMDEQVCQDADVNCLSVSNPDAVVGNIAGATR
jgi:hypothetical protein